MCVCVRICVCVHVCVYDRWPVRRQKEGQWPSLSFFFFLSCYPLPNNLSLSLSDTSRHWHACLHTASTLTHTPKRSKRSAAAEERCEECMNGKINQIIAETHLNRLFFGLATVLPTPCQRKKCTRGKSGKTHNISFLIILFWNVLVLITPDQYTHHYSSYK